MLHRAVQGALAGLAVVTLAAVPVQAQQKNGTISLGIVSFLTGPAAAPFGIPGRNGAEILIEALNKGQVPAPFNKTGFGGHKLEVIYEDHAADASKAVNAMRRLVEVEKVQRNLLHKGSDEYESI